MRLIALLLVLIAGMSCTSNRQKLDCNRFKTGRFMINLKLTGDVFEIDRNGTYQTEYSRTTDSIRRYKVKWTSSCEYELLETYERKRTSTDSNQSQRIIEYVNEKPLKVRITATGNSFYVFESWKDGIGFVYKDTMWVLK